MNLCPLLYLWWFECCNFDDERFVELSCQLGVLLKIQQQESVAKVIQIGKIIVASVNNSKHVSISSATIMLPSIINDT